MKTTKILGATTLAGALLFTGVGAAHSNEAHADSQNQFTVANQTEWQIQHDRLLQGRLSGKGGGEGGGPGSVNSYDKTYQEYLDNNKKYAQENGLKFDIRSEKESAELFKDDDSVNFEAEANKLHGQQQAPDNTVTTQNNNQQQAVQNNATQAQELPATGETTNNGLVASIATALLAVGSLLTFKRFSKEK